METRRREETKIVMGYLDGWRDWEEAGSLMEKFGKKGWEEAW
jgi:hypothetical protein